MNRRGLLQNISRLFIGMSIMPLSNLSFAMPVLKKTKEEWRALLPGKSYVVLFEEATERAGSSPLNNEKRPGTYVCAACFQPLFKSTQKYDSRTGWPSFFDVLPNSVATKPDNTFFTARTEYHCARCGGHQGHVFKDGPPPTGLRYCNNGVALEFVPSDKSLPKLRT